MKYVTGKIYSLVILAQLLSLWLGARVGTSFGYYGTNDGWEVALYGLIFVTLLFILYSALYIGELLRSKKYWWCAGAFLLTLAVCFIALIVMFGVTMANSF